MSDTIAVGSPAPSFTLPNAGPGPDPLSLATLAADADVDLVVLLCQRDHRCTNCREQVQAVAARYDEFRALGATVVSLLPEPVERARDWVAAYDLPYPLLADPNAAVSDRYDQPVRFGPLGRFSDFLGRMPEAVVVDVRGEPTVAAVHRGASTWDRPDVDELLAMVRRAREDGPGGPGA